MVDGKKFVRLVSFDPSLGTTFDTVKHEKKPVNINNCIVKHGRDAGQLEIQNLQSRYHQKIVMPHTVNLMFICTGLILLQ